MKIDNLSIENFRGFERFHLSGLGRVNLLVGTNNSGKTSVLEAIELLASNGHLPTIWTSLTRRGEEISSERERQVEIGHLFRGHEINDAKGFKISADIHFNRIHLNAQIKTHQPSQPSFHQYGPLNGFEQSDDSFWGSLDSLCFEWSPGPKINIPLDSKNRVSYQSMKALRSSTLTFEPVLTHFITPLSLTPDTVASLLDQLILTPDEDLVIQAMRIIEPNIDRIATAGSDKARGSVRPLTRGNIVVRLKNSKTRIPIGCMGDGLWRMLGLALAVIDSANGIVLVDEIDTGLHYTVLEDMWTFLKECCQMFDAQLIATTHSSDCYRSLASVCQEDIRENSQVTINRVERNRETAVSYSEQEIVAAADFNIEVR